MQAYKVYQAGAENGLFLSMYQRSLYNIDTLTGRPWWTIEETGYQEYFKVFK
jgi:aspartate beta-hydroxylase